jgi:hypothetical protein
MYDYHNDRSKLMKTSWVWWDMPLIPALGRLRQEKWEFKANLDLNKGRPCFKKTKNSLFWTHLQRCSAVSWRIVCVCVFVCVCVCKCECEWYWGLKSGPPPLATPPALFCDGFSWDRISQTIWITVFLISASWVARIIGVSHWLPARMFS